jgi:Cu(I)/Ag(I) efflux system protein CusF
MKKLILALALVALPVTSAFAEPVAGEIKKINESAGKITIKHGPIPKLDMDAMTMVFRVADASFLKQVKVGDKIKFEADRVNGALTVTSLTK